MFWTDWTQRGILVANKYTGAGIHFYKSGISAIMDLKVMHHSSQQGKLRLFYTIKNIFAVRVKMNIFDSSYIFCLPHIFFNPPNIF